MAALLARGFEGFAEADFAAFSPEKWQSNRFNLERRLARERLEALARAIRPELAAGVPGLEADVSAEMPSVWNGHCVRDLWLYFVRPDEERRRLRAVLDRARSMREALTDPAPYRKHLFLGVRLGLSGLEAGLVLPEAAWVDRENACAVVVDASALGEAAGTLTSLEPGWRVHSEPLRLVWRFRRDDAALAASSLGPLVAAKLLALAPVYRMVAWAGGNDRIDLATRLGAEAAAVRVREAEATAARQEREVEHRRRAELAGARAMEAQEARRAAEEAFRRLLSVRSVPPAVARPTPPPKTSRAEEPAPARRRPEPKREREAEASPFSAGDVVRMRRGLLEGRTGVVRELEGSQLRVEIGGLSVRVSARDVEAAREESQ